MLVNTFSKSSSVVIFMTVSVGKSVEKSPTGKSTPHSAL
jgi:hypothetical protein